MKYQTGDKILVLHSKEEGTVVDIINDKMVMIDVDNVRFPVYMDQIDFRCAISKSWMILVDKGFYFFFILQYFMHFFLQLAGTHAMNNNKFGLMVSYCQFKIFFERFKLD